LTIARRKTTIGDNGNIRTRTGCQSECLATERGGVLADWNEISRLIGSPVRPLCEGSFSLFENTLLDRRRIYDLFEGVRNRSGLPFALQVGIKGDRHSDAISACISGTQWIVISEGLIDTLDRVFSMLPKVLDGFPFVAPGHVIDPSRLRAMPDGPPNAPINLASSEPTNILLAGYMAHAALRFVADHEFFHAFHGHLLLIEELQERQRLPARNGNALNYDRDIRLALELEADRSAVSQYVVDLVSEAVPGNAAVDCLSAPDRLTLLIMSIAIIMAIWAAEEETSGAAPGVTHPRWECRLYMLLGPTLIRSLRLVGFDEATVSSIHRKTIKSVFALELMHPAFMTIASALDHNRMQVHDLDGRRLEMVYRLTIAPLLMRHQFSGLGDSDARITSVR
jgi:hypothetical protein